MRLFELWKFSPRQVSWTVYDRLG